MAATIELNRTTTELQAWTVLDDNASGTPFLVTPQVDISSEVACLLNINMGACTTAAIATAGQWIAYGKSGGIKTTGTNLHVVIPVQWLMVRLICLPV